jgi:hypothetical protein
MISTPVPLQGRARGLGILSLFLVSAAWVVASCWRWLTSLQSLLLPVTLHAAAIAVTEACFYLFYYRKLYIKLNAIPQPCCPAGYTAADADRAWRNFLHLSTAGGSIQGADAWGFLRHWFVNAADVSDIKRGNVEEMLVRRERCTAIASMYSLLFHDDVLLFCSYCH